MNRFLIHCLVAGALLGSTPALAQTASPTRAVPQCKQFPGSDLTVPCTGVVPIDGATGNPINWRELFSNITLDGDVTVPDTSVAAGATSAKAQAVQNTDGSKVATDATLSSAVTQLTNVVSRLSTLITNLGSPAQAGAPVTLAAGTQSVGSVSNTGFAINGTLPAFTATPTFNLGTAPNLTVTNRVPVSASAPTYADGSFAGLSLTPSGALRVDVGSAIGGGTGGTISNTAFGISGTLPAFAATPTFNLGTLNGAATDASINSVKTTLGSPFQAGGSIGNTSFGATQSGAWNVGLSGTLPAFASTPTFNVGTVPVLTANTLAKVSTAAPSYTNGDNAALSLTATGALRVNLENAPAGGGTASTVVANIGTTNGLALDSTLGGLFKSGQSIGNTAFGATQSGTWNVGVTGPVAVTGTFYQAVQPVNGTVTANLGTVGGLATDSTLTAVKTALGSPLQAGGTIGNTAFGIAGTLPAFAATPTVNLGTIAGAATDAKVEAVRALLAGTIKVDNGVALDGSKNATMNLSTFDRQLLSNVSRGAGPVSSFASMTVGTSYDVGNGIGIACTAEGNVVLQGADDSTITVPVSAGYNQFAFAIKRVVSQTATCTFTRLS